MEWWLKSLGLQLAITVAALALKLLGVGLGVQGVIWWSRFSMEEHPGKKKQVYLGNTTKTHAVLSGICRVKKGFGVWGR